MRFLFTILLLTASITHADSLSIDFQSKDFSTKGTFTFEPGSPLKISSTDRVGKPIALVIESKVQKEDIIQFEYKLERSGKTIDGGSIITQRGKIAKLESGLERQKPTVQFEAQWTE